MQRTEKNKSDWGLGPCPIVGVPMLWVVGSIGKSEQGGEGAIVWCSLPVCEHFFLFKALRPVWICRIPFVAWASSLVVGLGKGVERCQGSELRQVALVEFISILRVGRGRKTCYLSDMIFSGKTRMIQMPDYCPAAPFEQLSLTSTLHSRITCHIWKIS